MTPSNTRRRLSALGATCALVGTATLATTAASAASGTLDVAVTGSDSAAGTLAAPLRTIQAAIDRATPGTTIRIHKGTYSQQLTIRKSGTAAAPITVTAAGDGPVKVTSSQTPDSCASHQPSSRRTIRISDGADYWRFSGLWLENGALIAGAGSGKTYSWHAGLAAKGQWEARRKPPGTAKKDPVGAKNVVPYLRTMLRAPNLDSADHIEFIGNKLTGRGIYATLSSYGVVKNNVISDIICGSGPGVWVMNFSNFWEVSGNDVSKVAKSTRAHYMQEGIRFGTAANYNHIADNYVHDLQGDGRAFNTDVDASWNTFERNRAANVAIGYNDQMSGWGNVWQYNTVTGARTYGFGIRLKDGSLKTPSLNSSGNGTIMRCNKVIASSGKALGIGGIMNSSFVGNSFASVQLGRYLSGYWSKYHNVWNGSPKPPSATPAATAVC